MQPLIQAQRTGHVRLILTENNSDGSSPGWIWASSVLKSHQMLLLCKLKIQGIRGPIISTLFNESFISWKKNMYTSVKGCSFRCVYRCSYSVTRDPTTSRLCDAENKDTGEAVLSCRPSVFRSSAASVWRKPNKRANVSLSNTLSGEQAAPLWMALLPSEWCCAPQLRWLRKIAFIQHLIRVCVCARLLLLGERGYNMLPKCLIGKQTDSEETKVCFSLRCSVFSSRADLQTWNKAWMDS